MNEEHGTVQSPAKRRPAAAGLMRAVTVRDPSEGAVHQGHVPIPRPGIGQLLVKVEATTVISSELASLAGVSMAQLPLILGNDFIGTVVESPAGTIPVGTRVAGAYGGYGYTRNGAWAEYICVEVEDAFPFTSTVDSVQLAALPGSFTAAAGSLKALGAVDGRTLFIRGGTSGVGLAVATLAAGAGARVVSSTRDPRKRQRLLDHGVHEVVVDGTDLIEQVRDATSGGADLAVDVLGVSSLPTTLRTVRQYGIVCLTGLLADQTSSRRSGIREDRAVNTFPHPMALIPPTVRLTVGGVDGTPRTTRLMQSWIHGLETGRYRMPIDSVFTLDRITEAHARRADPDAFGKVVIAVGGSPDADVISQVASSPTT